MTDSHTPLSRAGLHKREQILATALRQARRRRHRRFTVRCTLACAAMAAIAVMWAHRPIEQPVEHPALVIHVSPTTRLSVTPAPIAVPTAAPDRVFRYRAPEIVIERIATDPNIGSRLAVTSPAGSVARISDDQLLEQLASAHQPAVLARFKGKAVLMYGNPSHSRHFVQ